MPRGRIPSGDYSNSVLVMIPIPKDLHKALKVQCIKEEKTMKEVLYRLNIKGIQDELGGKNNE